MVIGSHKSKDRQYNDQTFEDTKVVIGSHKSKDRQYNGQTKNDKKKSNDLQNTTQKTKYRATRTIP